jgi:hypothetical protein
MNKRLSISSCISCPYLQRVTNELIEDTTVYFVVDYICGCPVSEQKETLKIPVYVISDKTILNLCPLQDDTE